VAFGQQPGPPASARQVQALLALLKEAGYRDFRDARGPMGFNQRQAGGKFTRDEAEALIEQLQEAGGDAPPPPALRDVPAQELAAELQRRGWIVVEP
jgi:hypothetical protein